MWNRLSIWTGLLLSMAWAVQGSAQVDPQRAERYFNEAAVLCERDGGRLWGISLCGPMVIGDWRTDTIAMNQLPPTDVERPRGIGFANAPIDWGGTRWAAYIWDFITPLEDYPRARGELMVHELFHRIQPELGLVTLNGENSHLDTVDGRVWLRLEWRALGEALSLSGDDRLGAVEDALAFRSERRALFSDAEENERVEEIREGLAQYTGTVVTATSETEAVASALDQLEAAENQESFVQTFSYTSGVAYGLLLDMLIDGWRAEVRSTSDFGTLLVAGLGIEPTADVAEASLRYDGPEVRRVEQARYEERQATVRELRKRFVDGPVLLLPAGGGGTFDIRGATPIPGVGTVYFSRYRMQGVWGSLDASTGVLVNDDGSRSLAGPVHADGPVITGDGWTVTLAPGWIAVAGERTGDYQVVSP